MINMPLSGVVSVGWVVRNHPGDDRTLIYRWHMNGDFAAALTPDQLVAAYPECEITWAEYYERFPREERPWPWPE